MFAARRADGYELSDDPSRVDLGLVHHWLSTDSYWARDRAPEVTAAAIAGSTPVGVYRVADGRQVAFARVVTDGALFAYLCDLYVDRSCRGQGVGGWLVGRLRDALAARGLYRLALVTKDAHQFYAPLGFAAVDPEMWMECDLRRAPVTSATATEKSKE
jgi:GNAT superfamily N-acetyltransferase